MSHLAASPITASALVAAGGAIGAVARYQLGRLATHWIGIAQADKFPWGTLAANVLGSLAMGLLFGWLAKTGSGSETTRLFLGVGLLGGFTTFSAFSLEILLLFERGSHGLALTYILISICAGVLALYAGLLVMRGAL